MPSQNSPTNISDRRRALGVTQAHLAAEAHVTVAALSLLERGIVSRNDPDAPLKVESALHRLEAVIPSKDEMRRRFWTTWLEDIRPVFRKRVQAIAAKTHRKERVER